MWSNNIHTKAHNRLSLIPLAVVVTVHSQKPVTRNQIERRTLAAATLPVFQIVAWRNAELDYQNKSTPSFTTRFQPNPSTLENNSVIVKLGACYPREPGNKILLTIGCISPPTTTPPHREADLMVKKASHRIHAQLPWRFTGDLKKRKPDPDGSSVLKTPTSFSIASPWVSPSLHKDTGTASVTHAAAPEFLRLYTADCILTKGWRGEREQRKKKERRRWPPANRRSGGRNKSFCN